MGDRQRVANLLADSLAVGTKLGLTVAVLDGSGNQITSFGGSGGSTTTAATATLANVSGSASSVTLLASNSSRLAAVIVNDSTAILYVKHGSTASTTSYTYQLQAGDQLELPVNPIYTGIITGIWASATGSARTTELTA